ncbi:hypothetical protein Q8A67_010923 [Cirrhinus molitorella]|uniref:Uncharacterized protein n=1 Tax=Cirrhinus molitorella TaxID=172907 RepID=A0AA88TLN6_9TELE|nr:hypothetical protein Q8A67_010923 [Cirrhinus molitorella]
MRYSSIRCIKKQECQSVAQSGSGSSERCSASEGKLPVPKQAESETRKPSAPYTPSPAGGVNDRGGAAQGAAVIDCPRKALRYPDGDSAASRSPRCSCI